MSWKEIKQTPHQELLGILLAYSEYETLHSMDGYSAEDISDLAKNKPEIRSQYAAYMEARRKWNDRIGKKTPVTFKGLI